MVVGAAVLKTAHCRRRIPLAKELLRQLRLHRLRTRESSCSPDPRESQSTITTRVHVGEPLLKKPGVSGTFHILRHFFVTALIQSGVNAKVAQTVAGHHSASFTLGQ